MSFLSLIPGLGKIIEGGLGIIDKMVTDKDKANQLKAAIRTQILVNQHEEIVTLVENQAKIILAEAKGGWLQRNWRPMLMVIVMIIVANNYVIVPYVSAFTEHVKILELPGGLWALLNIGVGGYVAGRTAEKILIKK